MSNPKSNNRAMTGSKKSVPSSASLLNFRRKQSAGMTASSGSANNGDENPVQGKQQSFKYLTTDTSLGHVLTMIVLRICRKITIDVPLKFRFLYYFCLIIFGGILSDFAPVFCRAIMPIRTSKGNVLNVYFVKIGWGWTLALLSPFILMTSSIIHLQSPEDQGSGGDKNSKQDKVSQIMSLCRKMFIKDLTRIVICTLVWYFSVNLFVSIESVYGSCSTPSINATTSQTVTAKFPSKGSCSRQGYIWSGFDISGHTFLLMFSILTILEETGIMSGWEPFGSTLKGLQQHEQKTKRSDNQQYIVFERYSIFIRVLFVLLTLLLLIWDFMLIQTVLFYHTMIQKAVAGIWSVSLWFICYRIIFPSPLLSSIVRAPSKPSVQST